MHKCQSLVATTLLALALVGCNGDPEPPHPLALVVCPGATAIKWTKFGGTDQLGYRITIEYPAKSVLSCISDRLAAMGWVPLKEDSWNPGLPSSHVRGWTHFVDATVQPEAQVDAWAGQWQDKSGDLVWYYLTYRYPPDDRSALNVVAGFIPANLAKKEAKKSRN